MSEQFNQFYKNWKKLLYKNETGEKNQKKPQKLKKQIVSKKSKREKGKVNSGEEQFLPYLTLMKFKIVG